MTLLGPALFIFAYFGSCAAQQNNPDTACEPPPKIPHGHLTAKLKISYRSGDKVSYECDSDYALEKMKNEAVCADTQWKQIPVCRRIGDICNPPPLVIHGDIIDLRRRVYRSGSVVVYKCPSYYKLQGNQRVKCENGVWDDPPICLEPCTAGEREMRANNIQLRWTEDKKLYSEHNDEVEFGCLNGFEPSPSAVFRVKCNRGELLYPKCIKRGSCLLSQETMEINSIFINRSTEIEQGETIVFKCNEGMVPENTLTATCQEKNIMYPKCIIQTTCEPPPKIPHGRLEANPKISYRSNDKVSYECDSGYALEKMKNEAVCVDTQWEQIPVCRRIGEICNPPPLVIHGDITDLRRRVYRSGSVVEYKCPSYYKLQGNQRVKCENGVWDDPPICLEPCTTGEREMKANNIQLRWTDAWKVYSEHDDEVEFGCLYGYEPSPSAVFRIKCNRGELLYPKCIKRGSCLLSQETMERNSIFINRSTEIEQGETIVFKCNEGMVPENTLTATCQEKNIIYPKCITRRP
ncbi:complement factor H-related protein 1-like isoform X2 [Ascaphus truei]|uniref:complement factor H-related protein 1-like isoform X2 n=1 Tax=Ascaphus truei TaxID=8439 RepID=UPI003F5ACC93